MGGDCCGGGPHAGITESVASLSLEASAILQPVPAAPVNLNPSKSEAQVKEEKKPYYERRIQLFEQYRQREVDALESAKTANEPIKGPNAVAC